MTGGYQTERQIWQEGNHILFHNGRRYIKSDLDRIMQYTKLESITTYLKLSVAGRVASCAVSIGGLVALFGTRDLSFMSTGAVALPAGMLLHSVMWMFHKYYGDIIDYAKYLQNTKML